MQPTLTASSPAGTFPVSTGWPVVAGATLWTLSVVFFVIQPVAQSASTVPYDPATNLISDLGNTACGPDVCSPLHTWVNVTFVAVGAMHLLGALLVSNALPRRLVLVPTVLMMVAGAGLVVAGLSPENLDGFHHAAGALIGVVTLNLAMFAYGLLLVRSRPWLGRMALSAGAIGIVATGYFIAGAGWPAGTEERLADYPSAAMVVVLGVATLWLTGPGLRSRAGSRAAPRT